MNAPRRSHKRKTVWLKHHEIGDPPPSFRKDVLRYLGAKKAFATITDPGLNEELIWKWLWELARRVDDSKPQTSQWYSLPGLPLHTLRRFPKQVRNWAITIENLSHEMQLGDAYGRTASSLPTFLESQVRYGLTTVVPDALARRVLEARTDLPTLIELPKLLRLYADCLEAVCKFTAHNAPRAPARFRGNLEFALIEYVKRMTGKPHFPQIVTLLTAAYYAVGSAEIVDGRNLSAEYRRHSPWRQ